MFVFEAKISYEPTLFQVETNRLNSAEKVVAYMKDVMTTWPMNETFWVLLLNRKNVCVGRHLLTIGTQTSTLAQPREVFRAAVLGGATAIICVHNHPSGDPAPSDADVQATRSIRDASRVLEIDLLDHVILGDVSQDTLGKGYFSFRESGLA